MEALYKAGLPLQAVFFFYKFFCTFFKKRTKFWDQDLKILNVLEKILYVFVKKKASFLKIEKYFEEILEIA